MRKPSLGFTLIEVLVAVGIMAMSLVVLLGFEGNTVRMSGRSKDITVASWLARLKIVEIQMELAKDKKKGEFPEDKSENGDFEEPFQDYSWNMVLRKVELPAPPGIEEGSMQDMIAKQLTQQISQSVRELKVSIKHRLWDEKRAVVVTTHMVKL
ncbi:MAG: prepilin-type N-terminal cleavage/methylation domain-containing protein [Pseudomonadota bacterium]